MKLRGILRLIISVTLWPIAHFTVRWINILLWPEKPSIITMDSWRRNIEDIMYGEFYSFSTVVSAFPLIPMGLSSALYQFGVSLTFRYRPKVKFTHQWGQDCCTAHKNSRWEPKIWDFRCLNTAVLLLLGGYVGRTVPVTQRLGARYLPIRFSF